MAKKHKVAVYELKDSQGEYIYFKGKVAGRIQMIDELITVIRILEGE